MGRAARMPVVEADSESDDGAPEEVNMSTGKDDAERLRKEERDSRKRIIAAAKEKRKMASGPKERKSKKKQKAEAQAAAGNELDADNDEQEPQDQQKASRAVTHGLLDDTIVKFLAAQEKKVVEIKESQPDEVEPKKQKERKKKTGATSSRRVKVVVLSKVQPKAETFNSALAFRQNRLYGEGVHRSLVMLPKEVR